jgi:hypothetical protein
MRTLAVCDVWLSVGTQANITMYESHHRAPEVKKDDRQYWVESTEKAEGGENKWTKTVNRNVENVSVMYVINSHDTSIDRKMSMFASDKTLLPRAALFYVSI